MICEKKKNFFNLYLMDQLNKKGCQKAYNLKFKLKIAQDNHIRHCLHLQSKYRRNVKSYLEPLSSEVNFIIN